MDKNDVLEIYDEDYAKEYDQRFLINERSKIDTDFEQETINQLLSEIGEGSTWLDVACGTGYFLSCFPSVKRAGLDISPAMLKVARRVNPDALFVQGDYRDERFQWKSKWDLVSCMWLAYGYVESLSELEKVIENFAEWTSEQGVCFVPFCEPAGLGTGELNLPYSCNDLYNNDGFVQFEGVIWSWIDERSGKQHFNMLAPQMEYMLALFKKYFQQVEFIEYPLVKGAKRKAIVARSKKPNQTPKSKINNKISSRVESPSSFFKVIRASEWWLYKIAPLLAVAYAEIFLIHLPPLQSIITVLTFLLSISSVAAYGYIVNDTFDIEVDRKAGKSNTMAQFLPWQRFLFCLLFVATGFAVPILMKFGTLAIILLAINYLLPTLYSAPPLRLKERGIWGILSDAAGAHLVPTLFVAATFLHLSTTAQPNALTFSVIAAAWAFFAGMRGILLHQLWDRDNDINSSISTFVTQFPPESVRLWINRLVFPCEIILFSALAVVLSQFSPWILGFFTIYVLVTLTKLNVTQTPLDPSPPVGQNIIPHDLYEVWLPLALAILLVTRHPVFLIFFALTLVLFYPSIKIRTMEVVNVFKAVFSHRNPAIEKTRQKEQLEEQLENLREQLALKTQELEAQQVETLQAKTETNRHRESLQQFQEQAEKQIEPLQTQLQEAKAQLQHTQSELQISQTELIQSQSQLQISQTELIQSKSELQISQTELAQLKSYLQQTQGVEGIINYYRFRIASNPDDIQLYHQALTIKPDDAQSLWQLGNALVRQNRFDDAIASYQTALRYHPNNFEIHLELGKVLEKEKKWDEAIISYRRAIELNPDYSWSHQHLGDALAELGQIHEASACYRRALQLQPRIV
ncbi:tetratricopeptide repeat protein [Microcoleus sp. LAD1_D3]|uniref:tetratricopeptide repeat protein n=1 Tax=Microcoleus sp. LAD1_D3 TaxID=2819365 RepID=UPI002FCE765C